MRNGIHKHNAIDVSQYAINQKTFFDRLENNAVLFWYFVNEENNHFALGKWTVYTVLIGYNNQVGYTINIIHT